MVELVATSDAHVSSGRPDTNYGTAAQLVIATTANTYAKFDLSAHSSIGNAVLRLYIRNNGCSTDSTITFSRAASAWNESTLTWNNQPYGTGASVGKTVAAGVTGYIEVDVSAIVGDMLQYGNNGFLIMGSCSVSISFASRETYTPEWKPTLIIDEGAEPVTCTGGSPNHGTGCDLLKHWDADKDGVMSRADQSSAVGSHLTTGNPTMEELQFICDPNEQPFNINDKCPGCYSTSTHVIIFASVPIGATLEVDGVEII